MRWTYQCGRPKGGEEKVDGKQREAHTGRCLKNIRKRREAYKKMNRVRDEFPKGKTIEGSNEGRYIHRPEIYHRIFQKMKIKINAGFGKLSETLENHCD